MTPTELIAAAERIKNRVARPGDVDRLVVHVLATVRADDAELADRPWFIERLGWLPDGKGQDFGGVATRIREVGETESYGTEPAMQVLFEAGSLWLETYGIAGETLCLLELIMKPTRGQVRLLLRALGIEVSNHA